MPSTLKSKKLLLFSGVSPYSYGVVSPDYRGLQPADHEQQVIFTLQSRQANLDYTQPGTKPGMSALGIQQKAEARGLKSHLVEVDITAPSPARIKRHLREKHHVYGDFDVSFDKSMLVLTFKSTSDCIQTSFKFARRPCHVDEATKTIRISYSPIYREIIHRHLNKIPYLISGSPETVRFYIIGHHDFEEDPEYMSGISPSGEAVFAHYSELAYLIAKQVHLFRIKPKIVVSLVACEAANRASEDKYSFAELLCLQLAEAYSLDVTIHAYRGLVGRHLGEETYRKLVSLDNGDVYHHQLPDAKVKVSVVDGQVRTQKLHTKQELALHLEQTTHTANSMMSAGSTWKYQVTEQGKYFMCIFSDDKKANRAQEALSEHYGFQEGVQVKRITLKLGVITATGIEVNAHALRDALADAHTRKMKRKRLVP